MNNSHGMNNSRVTSLGTEKFFKIIESKGSTVLPSNWFSTNYSCDIFYSVFCCDICESFAIAFDRLGNNKHISKICPFAYAAAKR